jgi:hypothetical protein
MPFDAKPCTWTEGTAKVCLSIHKDPRSTATQPSVLNPLEVTPTMPLALNGMTPISTLPSLGMGGAFAQPALAFGQPSLLGQPGILDSFGRSAQAALSAPAGPISDVIVMDDFTNSDNGFQHGSEMVKTMKGINPNLQVSQVDVGKGNILTNVNQGLTQLLADVKSGRRPVPQGLNLSIFSKDANDPRVQSIKAQLSELANMGTLVTTVAGKVADASGNIVHRNIQNPGDRVVRNELADDNNPNIKKVDASGERVGAGNGADLTENARTTSFASATAMGNLSLQSARGPVTQRAVGTPTAAGALPGQTPTGTAGLAAGTPGAGGLTEACMKMITDLVMMCMQMIMGSLQQPGK